MGRSDRLHRQLPASIPRLDVVQEQRWLAQSKMGDHEQAIAGLGQLIAQRGDSSERRGLIAGRYKKFMDARRTAGDVTTARDFFDLSIEHSDRGMRLELNDFFSSSNLPFLYRERG